MGYGEQPYDDAFTSSYQDGTCWNRHVEAPLDALSYIAEVCRSHIQRQRTCASLL
jgi:hypothetical protein